MIDSRTVLDALLKDVDTLQNEMSDLKSSVAIEELETHLTEKMVKIS